jgi:hypothetical protein
MRQRGLPVAGLIALATLLALTVMPAAGDGPRPLRAFALADYSIGGEDGFEGSMLIPVAPVTGRRLPGRGVRLGDAVETYGGRVLSPDGRVVALGGYNFGEVVRVDLVRRRLLAPIKLDPACCDGNASYSVNVLAWPTAHRLIAISGQSEGKWTFPRALRIVDPAGGRLTASAPPGIVLATAVGPGGQVLVLFAPASGVGATRLVSVDRSGAVHSVTLSRIRSGLTPYTHREAALAVDFATERAFVLAAGDPAAEVDLGSLGVQYHRLASPALDKRTAAPGPSQPTGTQNPTRGSTRVARWLGHGLIAVSGSDSKLARGARQIDTPAGLRIVDTRRWTVRILDPGVSAFELANGTLLAASVAWDPHLRRFAGFGLAGFGFDGRSRYRLFPYRSTAPLDAAAWLLNAGRLYVWHPGGADELRDPRTGVVLRTLRIPASIYSTFDWRPPPKL